MKTAFGMTLMLLLGCTSGSASKAEVSPVQKVIQLLGGMLEKSKKEKHEEQVQFASYKQFCDDTSAEKKNAISDAEELVEVQKSDIQKYTAKAELLTKEIQELDEDISVWTGDVKATSKVRQIEKTDYGKTHKDYTESIDALKRAIATLKKQSHDRKQAKTSLLQVAALTRLSLISSRAKQAIDTFVQQDETYGDSDELAVSGAPEANGYEFQSSGIVDMLSKLADKFVDERSALEKEEQNARQAYELLVQDLEAQIKEAKKDSSEKSGTKAKAQQSKADTEGDLKDTTSSMNEDKEYLSKLVSTCRTKAADFETRQNVRADEITAIEKAIGIISGGKVAGAAEKHLGLLIQTGVSALPQLRAEMTTQAKARVASYLHNRARELNSQTLEMLANRVSADPFKKVKKMIKDMIVRLMEEANEEAEHKGWCDTELSTNLQTRKEKTEAVETLQAEIDELNASISKLTDTIGDLSESVAELDAAMAKATKIRQAEKAKNTETIGDANDAQSAVAQALTVLKEFYAGAAESTALLQQQEEPEIFDSPYKGQQAESGGVIGMLEVIESDFARLEADTRDAEATAAKEYKDFMSESKLDKAKKSTAIEHKSAKKQDSEQALTTKKSDLEDTQEELDAALAYFDKLKPSCVDSGTSYEERVSRRKSEIESLQDALKVLNGEDIA